MTSSKDRYIVGISGASGAIYGVRLVQALLAEPDRHVDLIVSPAAERVIAKELGRPPALRPFAADSFLDLEPGQAERLRLWPHEDIGAGPASGTFRAAAMVVCPASARTLGAIASGLADNLLTRAADVSLKEGRPLVVVPRETPLSTIHLQNMLTIAQAGGCVLPASPAFYHHPRSIDDMVAFIVQKIMDRLGLDAPDPVRWGSPK